MPASSEKRSQRVGNLPMPIGGDTVFGLGTLTAMVLVGTSSAIPCENGDPMTLLTKKAGGLGLVLLGGLTLAHAAYAKQIWEAFVGIALLAIGIALLIGKVVRRNMPSTNGGER
jgi:hypothetical protein